LRRSGGNKCAQAQKDEPNASPKRRAESLKRARRLNLTRNFKNQNSKLLHQNRQNLAYFLAKFRKITTLNFQKGRR